MVKIRRWVSGLLIIALLVISGCDLGKKTDATESSESQYGLEECPPKLKHNPTIIIDTSTFPDFLYSDIDKLGDYYSLFFSDMSFCRMGGVNAGENINNYYCYLILDCQRIEDNDIVIGFFKSITKIEYEIISKKGTKYGYKEMRYGYNASLKLKGCKTEKIKRDDRISCMEAEFSDF